MTSAPPRPISLYIDADACPVKLEVYRVAERRVLKGTALHVYVVSNNPIAVPRDPMIECVVVGGGMDAADDALPKVVSLHPRATQSSSAT